MPGLIDFLNSDDARLGLSLLAAGGPSATPMSAGQRIQGAMQGFQAQKDGQLRSKLLQSQIDENSMQDQLRRAQLAKATQLQDMTRSVFGALGAGASPSTGGMASASTPGAMPAAAGALGGGGPLGQPPQESPASGLRGVPIEKIAALKAAGGADLIDAWKLANVPTQLSAGGYTQLAGQAPTYLPDPTKGVDFRGGMVSRLPGSSALAALAGESAGATVAAKYPFTVGADRQRQVTQASLDPQSVVGPDGNNYFVPRLAIAGAGGGDAGSGGAPGQGGFMAGRNPVTQQSSIELNNNWVKNAYQPTIDAGKSAADISANIQALRNIDMNTGWGTEAKATGAAMLEGLGIASANAKLFASNSQKFQSVAMDRLMTMLQAQKGSQTEGDATRAKQTFVSLGNTPDANAFIMDFAQAKANQDQRRAQFYEAALPVAQKAGDLTRVDREWRKIQGSIWADPSLQRWSK